MALQVVGAGLGRTGTMSLKVALEQLLGGPCYHMAEVFARPEHIALWSDAAAGRMPDWNDLFSGYPAAVDWPMASFWPEIAAAFPQAVILLSVRDAASWWKSASDTIFQSIRNAPQPWRAMVEDMMAARFTNALEDRASAITAFEKHNADVLRTAPRARLLVWESRDGWQPLCEALDAPVPDAPFPRVNTTEEFRVRAGMQ
jgi:hypothetical protein